MRPLRFLPLLLATVTAASAQGTQLSGVVNDPSGAAVPRARVEAVDRGTSAKHRTETDNSGNYSLPFLRPGLYDLTVEANGFRRYTQSGVRVEVAQAKRLDFSLEVGPVEQTVSVQADAPLVNTQDGSVGTAVNQRFIANQPLNGRSFQSLIDLSPGVVFTPSNVTAPGQFSVNGQRAGANYFTVDGVSANFATSASATLYDSAGGGVPAYSALGTTASLASLDAVEEFRIQTSTYAPEYGRQPGAQISVVTRGGANLLRGSAYEYLRNDAMDANDWFANRNRLSKPAMRQNNFGFTAGGPIWVPKIYDGRNRTLFFASYEGLRLRQPIVSSPAQVPTKAARDGAPASVRGILRSFPLPNVGETGAGAGTFVAGYSNPSSLDAGSLRIDQTLSSSWTLFGRFHHSPSETRVRDLSSVLRQPTSSTTITAGLTGALAAHVSNDFRVNYSRSSLTAEYGIDHFAGATAPADGDLLPSFATAQDSLAIIFIGSTVLNYGRNVENKQRQINIVDAFSWTTNGHSLKFGFDYRRLAPTNDPRDYARVLRFANVEQALAEALSTVTVVGSRNVLYPLFRNYSAFAQDTWRASARLTLTYGLRWDVNPAPSERGENPPYTVTGAENPATMALAPPGTRLYPTTWGNVAPRAGVAFQPFRRNRTVLRGGFGVFYDLGYTFAGSGLAANFFPYGTSQSQSNLTMASPFVSAAPPAPSVTRPYGELFAYQADYKLPYTLQYSFTVEEPLGAASLVSAAYVGSVGRRLGRVERLRNPNPDFTFVNLVRNEATSDYNSLQLQYQRRFSRGLQALMSYTWAKSLDVVSEESILNFQAPVERVPPTGDRGPSSFDIRQSLSLAISYEPPRFRGPARRVLTGWAFDSIVRARSAPPVNVLTGVDTLGLGFNTVSRPDVAPGVPLYLEGNEFAGGKRINPAAFVLPAGTRQGTLGRNSLRGFGAAQWDLAVRRHFVLTEGLTLQFRADAYNLTNHPNFASPVNMLNNPNFGHSTQMLNRGLAGLSPLYQIGGPRSMQVAARLIF